MAQEQTVQVHTVRILILFLIGTSCSQAFFAASQPMVKPLKLERFVEFLVDAYSVTENEPTRTVSYKEPLKQAQLLAKELSTRLSTDKTLLRNIFERYPASFSTTIEWPTPRIVATWKASIGELARILRIYGADQYAMSDEQIHIFTAAKELCQILTYNLLNDGFFLFSVSDRIYDFCVDRPMGFAKKHPYITTGMIVVSVVGTIFLYKYATKMPSPAPEQLRIAEALAWGRQNGAEIIISRQAAGAQDCGVWSLYRQRCYHQATDAAGITDMDRYRALTTDMTQYNAFKVTIEVALAEANPGQPAPLTRNLEGATIADLADWCVVQQPPLFQQGPIVSNDLRMLNPENEEFLQGLNPNMDVDRRIAEFRGRPGATIDFIQRFASHRRGHWAHIHAINVPDAPGGVKLVFSDSYIPHHEEYIAFSTAVRQLLQPQEPQ